jgi:hypothetical protein
VDDSEAVVRYPPGRKAQEAHLSPEAEGAGIMNRLAELYELTIFVFRLRSHDLRKKSSLYLPLSPISLKLPLKVTKAKKSSWSRAVFLI